MMKMKRLDCIVESIRGSYSDNGKENETLLSYTRVYKRL